MQRDNWIATTTAIASALGVGYLLVRARRDRARELANQDERPDRESAATTLAESETQAPNQPASEVSTHVQPPESRNAAAEDWAKRDWLDVAIKQKAKLLDEARAQGGELVVGADARKYPPLTGTQAKAILDSWMEILKSATDAAKYVKAGHFDAVLKQWQSARAGATLAGSNQLADEDVVLVFAFTHALARALNEAAMAKSWRGDPPTTLQALWYGIRHPGEIPGAVVEAEKQAAKQAAKAVKEAAKEAKEAAKDAATWLLPMEQIKSVLKWIAIVGGGLLGLVALIVLLK